MKEEEQEADIELGFETGGAALVSLAPFSSTPSARRLSSNFAQPSRPIVSAKRLAWVSLQGRLVNAEEASSAKTVGLSRAEAVAWELFTPIQRFLIVAVIGVAVAESKKNRLIWQLTEAVELRVRLSLSLSLQFNAWLNIRVCLIYFYIVIISLCCVCFKKRFTFGLKA